MTTLDELHIEPLGVQLKRYRKAAGVTCEKLAEQAAVSESYISLIENGLVNTPSPEYLKRIETALDLPAGTFTRLGDVLRTPPEIVSLIPESTLADFLEGVTQ